MKNYKETLLFKKPMINFCRVFFLTIALILLASVPGYTQSEIPSPIEGFRFQVSVFGGGGQQQIDVGTTTEGDLVKISPGGGGGAKISVGYFLSPLFDINLEIGTQQSSLEELQNAEGSFSRNFFLGTLRYAFPISEKNAINIGGGAGYYIGGKLNLELSQVPGGAHLICDYNSSAGFHALAEFESYFTNWTRWSALWSWSIGLKYYQVSYDLKCVSVNGITVPGHQIPLQGRNEFSPLDGTSVNVVFSINMR